MRKETFDTSGRRILREEWTSQSFRATDASGVVLEERPLTPSEQAAVQAEVERGNQAALREQATNALAGNRAYLALASPTNAQTLAQVRSLTRQNNALIRLAVDALDGTD